MREKQNNDDETKMQTDKILLTFASTNSLREIECVAIAGGEEKNRSRTEVRIAPLSIITIGLQNRTTDN